MISHESAKVPPPRGAGGTFAKLRLILFLGLFPGRFVLNADNFPGDGVHINLRDTRGTGNVERPD